jgi:hypothetical protein
VAVRSTAATGQDSIVDELDSNDLAASTVAQVRREPWRDAGFDFQDNVHYSDESLVKTTIGGNPLIRTIQICATICQDPSAGAAARVVVAPASCRRATRACAPRRQRVGAGDWKIVPQPVSWP